MLGKLNSILIYALVAFGLAVTLYPLYISFLKYIKAWKTLREDAVIGGKAEIFQKLHAHKAGTPTMGGGMFLIIMLLMVALSFLLVKLWWINNDLVTREETYIVLFAFFSMGLIGMADDYLNIQNFWTVKGLSAKTKLIGMCLFAGFISYWFFDRLGISYINFWPLAGKIDLGLLYPVVTFFFTIAIVNAINITDGLDGLAWGLLVIVLSVLAFVTFFLKWYLATTVIGIALGVLFAFLWFNIHPAKVFMGDSWAFAMGGLISALFYLLNIRMGILIPFMIVFFIFWAEVTSSFLQIMSKKYRGKKLFPIAPVHHLFEYWGNSETTIVMKFWLVQWLLAAWALIVVFYQLY